MVLICAKQYREFNLLKYLEPDMAKKRRVLTPEVNMLDSSLLTPNQEGDVNAMSDSPKNEVERKIGIIEDTNAIVQPRFILMSSHKELIDVINYMRENNVTNFTIEDVKEAQDIMIPNGQSMDSIIVRLQELVKHGIIKMFLVGRKERYYTTGKVLY